MASDIPSKRHVLIVDSGEIYLTEAQVHGLLDAGAISATKDWEPIPGEITYDLTAEGDADFEAGTGPFDFLEGEIYG